MKVKMLVRSKKSLTLETQDESNDYCDPLAVCPPGPRQYTCVTTWPGVSDQTAWRPLPTIPLSQDLAFPRRLNVLSGTAAIMVTPIILHVDWLSHEIGQGR